MLKNVEIPSNMKVVGNLQYQSIIKGIIKGAFEVLKFQTETTIIY